MKRYFFRCRTLYIAGTAILMAVLFLVYCFAAKPVFIYRTINAMNRGFQVIRSMEPGEDGFDDDDIDTLDELNHSYNVVIADSGKNIVYGSLHQDTASFVLKIISEKEEKFSAEPCAEAHQTGKSPERMMITLKGRLEGEDTVYYVYLYKRIRTLMSSIALSGKLLAILFGIFFLLETIWFLFLSGRLFHSMERILDVVRRISSWAVHPGTVHPEKTEADTWDQDGGAYLPPDQAGGSSGKLYTYFADSMRPVVSRMFTQEARLRNFEYMMKQDAAPEDESSQLPKELLRNITHQLKTPLAIISSQLELDHAETDPAKKDYYYQSVMDEIDKMSAMISDILKNYSNKQSYAQIRLCRICISDLLTELAYKYTGWLGTDRIIFGTEIEPDLYVMADAIQISQAVNNYMMNAYSHTKPRKKICLSLKREGDDCLISVHNEGNGIPEEELQSIWKDHFTGSSGENSDQSGAGLGLYIVDMIVDKHDGKCGCFNDRTGVTFWISLPAR